MDVHVGHLSHGTGKEGRLAVGAEGDLERAARVADPDGAAPSRTPQLRAAAAAATLPVPQARVSPTPRSQTRKSRRSPSSSCTSVIHSTLMPPLKVDWSLGPDSAMSTAAVSGPRSTRCGLPTSTVRARRSSNSWGCPDQAAPVPCRRWPGQPGCCPGGVVDGAHPAPGGHREAGRGTSPASDRSLGQAADAVAAHFGLSPVRIVQLHGEVGAVTPRADTDDPVGSDAATTIGQEPNLGHREPGRSSGSRTTRKSLPATFVLCGVHPPFSQATPLSRARPGPAAPAAPPCQRSRAHPIRGSRRNQGPDRGELAGAANGLLQAASSGRRLDVGEQLLVAKGLAGRPRHPPGPGARARTSSSRPAATMAPKRASMRRSPRRGRAWIPIWVMPSPGRTRARARSRRTGGPHPSSPRAPARSAAGWWVPSGGRHRVERCQPGLEVGRCARPSSSSASSAAATSG